MDNTNGQTLADEELIQITKKEYEALKYDSRKLSALEAGGVDNWVWYSESLKGLDEFEDN